MGNKLVLYLHGFASSGQGTKAQYFREKFEPLSEVEYHAFEFNPTPKDFEYMTITGLINRLRQYLVEHQHDNVSFIGSSLGGLIQTTGSTISWISSGNKHSHFCWINGSNFPLDLNAHLC